MIGIVSPLSLSLTAGVPRLVELVVAFAALVVAFRMGETREAARQDKARDARAATLYRRIMSDAFGVAPVEGFAAPGIAPDTSFGPAWHPLADPTFRLVAADDQTAISLLLRGTP